MTDSIQDLRAFSQRMYDIVEDYLKYKDNTFADDGVYVADNLEMSIVPLSDELDKNRVYTMESLIRVGDNGFILEPDGDRIDEIASQYIFVR